MKSTVHTQAGLDLACDRLVDFESAVDIVANVLNSTSVEHKLLVSKSGDTIPAIVAAQKMPFPNGQLTEHLPIIESI